MALPEQDFGVGLNTTTLNRVTELSALKENGERFRLIVRPIGPFTDEIVIEYPDGKVTAEYIEELLEKHLPDI